MCVENVQRRSSVSFHQRLASFRLKNLNIVVNRCGFSVRVQFLWFCWDYQNAKWTCKIGEFVCFFDSQNNNKLILWTLTISKLADRCMFSFWREVKSTSTHFSATTTKRRKKKETTDQQTDLFLFFVCWPNAHLNAPTLPFHRAIYAMIISASAAKLCHSFGCYLFVVAWFFSLLLISYSHSLWHSILWLAFSLAFNQRCT